MRASQLSLAALGCLCAALRAASALAADDPGETRFLLRWLCPVGEIVSLVRETPWTDADEQNRFIILYLPREPAVYAQCALYDGGKAAQCEAVSPFYEVKGEPFRRARLPALARLGYDLDGSKGNYVKRLKLDTPGEPPLAEFLLRTLYEGFLNESDSRIAFDAPLAKSRPPPRLCAPSS